MASLRAMAVLHRRSACVTRWGRASVSRSSAIEQLMASAHADATEDFAGGTQLQGHSLPLHACFTLLNSTAISRTEEGRAEATE